MLAGKLKVNVGQAKKFIDQFLGSFPAVHSFLKRTVVEAKKSKEVRTLLQRRRALDFHADTGRAERQAVNSVIQGTAADIVCPVTFLTH